ncbi:MAG: dethiobiotin synthase [Chitinophagaceae bacterium]|nr:dethiobiotin synthase [Chitinophagaceae bacterium]
MKNIIVAGIGTGIGKTFIAAIITEALQADYWKPVQAGSLDCTDRDTVRSLITNTTSLFHPETYRFSLPVSPHTAAEEDGLTIELNKLQLPLSENGLVIELAGGLMVPLNKKELNIDLLKQWKTPVILVSQNYLGSINHTLLSLGLLKQHAIKLAGIIFNGESNASGENFILNYTQSKCLGHINRESTIHKAIVKQYAEKLKPVLNNL